jgi:hypothetical protein
VGLQSVHGACRSVLWVWKKGPGSEKSRVSFYPDLMMVSAIQVLDGVMLSKGEDK